MRLHRLVELGLLPWKIGQKEHLQWTFAGGPNTVNTISSASVPEIMSVEVDGMVPGRSFSSTRGPGQLP